MHNEDKPVLGMGLAALIGEKSESVRGVHERDKKLEQAKFFVADMCPSRFQPRKNFDENAIKELSESIKRNGLMQPIVLRRIKDRKSKEKYEIIAGERRWRAAKLAGLLAVPAIVKDISDQQALELALIENIQRQDLNAIEEANGIKRLIDECDYSQEEAAKAVGKSRSHVSNLMRLLSLPPKIQEMIVTGKITMGHARALVSIKDAENIALQIVKNDWSVRQLENHIRSQNAEQDTSIKNSDLLANNSTSKESADNLKKIPVKSHFRNNDSSKSFHSINFKQLSQRLSDLLGQAVEITSSNGRNIELAINFSGEAKIEQFVSMLEKSYQEPKTDASSKPKTELIKEPESVL